MEIEELLERKRLIEEGVQIGDYVRTWFGIKRVDKINENATINRYLYKTGNSDWEGVEYGIIRTNEVRNRSKNIIDLLEEGDFAKVNACGIIFTTILKQSDILSFKGDGWKLLEILTKEQYEKNCYVVKE